MYIFEFSLCAGTRFVLLVSTSVSLLLELASAGLGLAGKP